MFRDITCKIFGHKFITVRRFAHTSQVYCTRCHCYFLKSEINGCISKWNETIDNIYKYVEEVSIIKLTENGNKITKWEIYK